ncbi:FUSC family protein [Thioclava sp. 'Guangxiensis']|uniref:FUSC family protein n=1 Tax=Thioclava sp. 'Guangxiensis' TaxID=3149044 RepID=UPI0038781D36
MPQLTADSVLPKAFRLFIAALIALSLSELLGFHNTYWAAMPVFVIAQPVREDMLIRGLLRVAGTIAGAAIGILTLLYLHNPLSIGLAVGATVAIGTGIAYRIGTTYSYGFTLMAFSCGVIVMPSLGLGADGVTLALERLWSTLIGVASITLVSWYFTPSRNGPVPPRPVPHSTRQMLMRMAFVGGLCTLTTTATGLAPHFAVMSAGLATSVFCAVIGSMNDPRPIIRWLVPGVFMGVCAAILYRFIISQFGLDHTQNYILAIIFIAIGSLIRAHPKTAAPGLDINMCFLLAGEAGAVGHSFELTAYGACGLIAGNLLVAGVLHLIASLRDREGKSALS